MIKRTLTILAAGAFLLGVGAQQMQAVLINGSITISGGADLNTSELQTATRVDAWTGPEVQSVAGDFDTASVNPGSVVVMNAPWNFNSGIANLWTVGGFTFNLNTSVVQLQNASFLLVEGFGTASGNGYEATPGIFRFTTQEPESQGVFSFSASVGTIPGRVPDGGTTGMLLGLAFLGAAAFRRKLS